jgi:hypothetical protein
MMLDLTKYQRLESIEDLSAYVRNLKLKVFCLLILKG